MNKISDEQTSGAIQYGVPMKDFLLLIVAVIWAETPKSASLTSPLSVSSIFAPWKYKKRKPINTQTMIMKIIFWQILIIKKILWAYFNISMHFTHPMKVF